MAFTAQAAIATVDTVGVVAVGTLDGMLLKVVEFPELPVGQVLGDFIDFIILRKVRARSRKVGHLEISKASSKALRVGTGEAGCGGHRTNPLQDTFEERQRERRLGKNAQ